MEDEKYNDVMMLEKDDNKSKLESKDILDLIKQSNADNSNVAKMMQNNDDGDFIDDTPDEVKKEEEKEINKQPAIDLNLNLKSEESGIDDSKKEEVDAVLKKTGISQELQEEIKKMLLDVQDTYHKAYQQKEKELIARKDKELDEFKKKVETDTLRTLSAEEQEKYKRELKAETDRQKIEFLSNRVVELENLIRDIENQKFITERISNCPAVKPFIEKMNIKTKEDYESKIEPIIDDIRQYEDFRKNNKNGNSNAFRGYGRQNKSSSKNSNATVSKDYLNGFLKQNIMK